MRHEYGRKRLARISPQYVKATIPPAFGSQKARLCHAERTIRPATGGQGTEIVQAEDSSCLSTAGAAAALPDQRARNPTIAENGPGKRASRKKLSSPAELINHNPDQFRIKIAVRSRQPTPSRKKPAPRQQPRPQVGVACRITVAATKGSGESANTF